jgi:16S rRNA G966 N2-methylase RsmD
MYNWHKFWGRKTWNVVGEFIGTYCRMDDVVLDPFSGSGVAALEALKIGRRVIAVDLNPVATEILRLTILQVDLVELENAFHRVEEKVKETILDLYKTQCRKCGADIPIECAVWTRDKKKNLSLEELRYKCPHCDEVVEKGGKPSSKDLKRMKAIAEEFKSKRLWYPKNPLYYSDGRPFMKKERYDSLDELFTPRNLYSLALIMNAIEKESDEKLRDFLKIAFSSMVHLCTTMGAVSDPLPTSHHTSFSSTGWTQHSYWFAREFMEQNVWNKYESALLGHQGLMKAKAESNGFFKKVKFTSRPSQVLDAKADICIVNKTCLDVLEELPSRSIDYIFTDPPYDASIQYGELSYLWAAWLKKDKDYVDRISEAEIVRNEKQHKDFEVYHTLLRRSFEGMYKVLKLGRYLTLTFHNPTFKVRNATIRAGTYTGFDFEKIHHQPTAQKSGKSLLQPFGSAMGDFYLRFRKPQSAQARSEQPEEITEQRFEKIVVDTTVALLAERAEPTPYTIVINYIDPVLARHGFFSSVETGLDVKTALTRHVGREFKLVSQHLGGARGKLWWFNDPSLVTRLHEVPLSERVEQTVLRLLKSKGRITFTDAWEAVSIEFPNSLTSDSTSIKESLNQFSRQVSGGYWLLKPQINERERQHSEIIAILAQTGQSMGYKIWVGKKEQADSYEMKPLETYVTANVTQLSGVADLKTIEMIDLLWVKGNNVTAAFEVESTTTMTSALVRGSNLPPEIPKYLVIPEEREEQFQHKMKSPMFAERFAVDQWEILFFDTIRLNQKKLRSGEVTLKELTDQKAKRGLVREPDPNYSLFVEQA